MLLFASASWAAPAYVHADVLNVRAAPASSADRVAQLRIGTLVEVGDTSGEWAQITVGGRPPEHPVRGWVVASFLGPVEPDPRALTEGVPLLERWVALDPANPAAWSALDQAYQAAKHAKGVERVRRFRDGLDPIAFAVCEEGRATLVARLAGGALTAADRVVSSDMGVWPWMEGTDNGARALSGTPFVAPWLGPSFNEAGKSPFAVTPCPPDDELCKDDPDVVRLGPCDAVGLLATAPLTRRAAFTAPFPDTLERNATVAREWSLPIGPTPWRLVARAQDHDGTFTSVDLSLVDPSGAAHPAPDFLNAVSSVAVYDLRVAGRREWVVDVRAVQGFDSSSADLAILWRIPAPAAASGRAEGVQRIELQIDGGGC